MRIDLTEMEVCMILHRGIHLSSVPMPVMSHLMTSLGTDDKQVFVAMSDGSFNAITHGNLCCQLAQNVFSTTYL